MKTSIKMAPGGRIVLTVRSGCPRMSREIGRRTETVTGLGWIPGAGRGWTTHLLDSSPRIMAGGRTWMAGTAEGAGFGFPRTVRRARTYPRSVPCILRRPLPSWEIQIHLEILETAAEWLGFRWPRAKCTCLLTRQARPTSP